MLRRLLLCAAFAIFVGPTSRAADPAFVWAKPGGLDVVMVSRGVDGRLMLVDTFDRIWVGHAPIPTLTGGGTAPAGWMAIERPRGVMLNTIALDANGRLFIAGSRVLMGPASVWWTDTKRLDRGWIEVAPPTLATIRAMTIAPDGTVWISGEWRDVFRLEGDRWIREVTPRPLHNEWMWMGSGGRGWILASSRRRDALYYRDQGGWKTVADGLDHRWSLGGLLYADEREAIVQGPSGLERFPAPGQHVGSTTIPGFRGAEEASVVLLGPQLGWSVEGGALFRIERGERRRVNVSNSVTVSHVRAFEGAGLFGTERGHWFQLTPAGEQETTTASLGLRLIDARHVMVTSGRVMGIAILLLDGREHAYLVNHDGYNATVPVTAIADRSAFAAASVWRPLSERLGISDLRMGHDLLPIYDTAALAADLDGDGDEDLTLITMYDGVRIYRNERDDHFLPWNVESRIKVGEMDLPTGGCLLDADGDGDLDLYLTHGLVSDRLWLNNGDAVFHDATSVAGIDTRDGGSSAACADVDGDGDTDVVVATGARGLLIQENVGVRGGVPTFQEHRLLLDRADLDGGPGLSTVDLASVALADLDGDGLSEIFAAASNGCDRLFHNNGGLAFEEDARRFPREEPCGHSIGADFVDLDGDGVLELVVTGRGGSRLYRQDGGVFHAMLLSPNDARLGIDAPMTRGSAIVDIDGDGDPDVLQGTDGQGAIVYENTAGKPADLVLRLIGPPGNGSAVGARVAVRPESGGAAVWREVPGGTGSGSHSSKRLRFTGLTQGSAYVVDVALPGRATERYGPFTVPFRGDIVVGPSGLWRGLARGAWLARHAFADPWRRWFAGAAVVGSLLVLLFSSFLFRAVKPTPIMWAAFSAVPALALLAVLVLPIDPGPMGAFGAPAVATVVAGTLVALRRSRMDVRPAPEMLGELSLALGAFRHNQLPQRVMQRLLFVLRGASSSVIPAGSAKAALLAEDLHAFRIVVLPELVSLARLAESVDAGHGRGSALVKRLTARLREATSPSAMAATAAVLVEIDRWIDALRSEVDRGLSLDLRQALETYVDSRRSEMSAPIRLDAAGVEQVAVRGLATELHRVLDILLENAWRAHGHDRNKIVTIRADRDGPRRVRVDFVDEGPGIDPAMRTRLFSFGESGWQGGHGFGLFFARRSVQRFGGTIEAVEGKERGACFRIELVTVRAHEQPREEMA